MKKVATPHSLGTERIPALLLRYAIPSIVAMTSTSLFNIFDSIFIGRGVGPLAISALAVAMPLMNIASAFGSMIGIGAASIVSIRLGQRRHEAAEQTLGNVVLLTLLVGVSFTAASLWWLDELLTAFGAGPQTIGYARSFMRIILSGTLVSHLYLSLNEVLRASGYPRRAMAITLSAVAINCMLNPFFIFVLGWGVQGSALATLLAQCTALGLTLAHFCNRNAFLRFRRGIFRLRMRIVGGILSIGFAPFLLHICASVVVVLVNHALSTYGSELYMGAYGIINRVTMLFLTVVSGLNQGMQPIVGYNYGARRYDRVLSALRTTICCGVTVTTIGFLIAQFAPRHVAALFVGQGGGAEGLALIDAAEQGLRSVLVLFPIVGFQIVVSNFFQYIGKASRAILLSLTRQLLFLVPLLLLLPPRMGVRGVWIAMPAADTAATLLAAVMLWFQVRSLRREEALGRPE